MTFPPDPESLLATGPEAHPAPERYKKRRDGQRERGRKKTSRKKAHLGKILQSSKEERQS